MADSQQLLERGVALHRSGSRAEAAAIYRSVLAAEPENVDAMHLLGLVLKSEGKLEEALTAIRGAVERNPQFADAHYNLGNTLGALGRGAEAAASFRRAILLKPELVEADYNLGNTLRDMGDLEGAAVAFLAALAKRPAYVEARHNLANVLKGLNRIDEALAEYRRVIEQRPELGEAHYNFGLALLLTGAFEEGWVKYERRWDVEGFPTPPRKFPQPLWTGAPATDKVLLIHSEQGLGDAIQFCRYLPLIRGRAEHIILECRKPLMRLFATLPGVDQIVEAGTPLPPSDIQAPLLSLPFILGTRMETIPGDVPYLRAEAEAVASLRARRDERFTVGLIWAGNKKPDPNRTIGLRGMRPLLDIAGVRFVGLQKELEPGDAELLPALGDKLDYWGSQLSDFADTAAAMEAVDLVISIDTGAAHLAGALGRPCWVFLPFSPDWRWLMHRETSPWYPSMQLYRQEARGDWTPAVARVAADLARRAGN